MTDPLTATAIAAAVRSGEQTARSVVERALGRVAEREAELRACNVVLTDEALAAADAIDASVPAAKIRVRSRECRSR